MREWLVLATNVAVDAIDWLALVLIVVEAIATDAGATAGIVSGTGVVSERAS